MALSRQKLFWSRKNSKKMLYKNKTRVRAKKKKPK